MGKKSDDSLVRKAAQMLAGGISEPEVAKACSRSRSWVQNIKRNAEFQQLVENFKKDKKKAFQEEIKNVQAEIEPELLEFRQQLLAANRVIFSTGAILLRKVREKVENLQPEDLQTSRISQTLKSTAETLNIALEIGKASVGIDAILEEVNEFKKPSFKGYEASSGYQSVSTVGRRN